MGKAEEKAELFAQLDAIATEAKELLTSKDAETINEFCYRKSVRDVMTDRKTEEQRGEWLTKNYSFLIELCQAVSKRTDEVKADLELHDKVAYVLDWYYRRLEPLLEEADDEVFDDKELWKVSNELLKMIIATRNPTLWEIFSWAYDSKYLAWAHMDTAVWAEYLDIIHKALPDVVLKYPKKPKYNERDEPINNEIYSTYSNICSAAAAKKKIDKPVQSGFTKVLGYCMKRLAEGLDTRKDDTVFHMIVTLGLGTITFQHIEIAAAVMSELEKLVVSGNMTEGIASLAKVTTLQVLEHKSTKLDSDYIQRQIDAFVKDDVMDYNQTAPELLLKSYPEEAEIIHKNLLPIAAKISSLPIFHAVNIMQLLKKVSATDAGVLTKDIVNYLYPVLSNESLTYFTFEILKKVSLHSPEIIDVAEFVKHATTYPVYLPMVCDILTTVGTKDSCTGEKAEQLISWLIPQCMNPVNHSNRPAMLTAAKSIGFKFKNQLMQFKPLILTLHNDASVQDVTTPILDFLENRSLAGVSKKVDTQETKIDNVTNEVAETKQSVQQIDEKVTQQESGLNNISNQVQEQKADLKELRAEFAEAMIDIERIDRKTLSVTPKWASKVADLLNPEALTDWRLLSKRLGYTNDDLKAWAGHENPCLTMLSEWYATHISSEATRAVYIVLKEMNREDAAGVVADAMENAGELVPEDQPLDLKHPPAIFISYQWGVQDKAIALKQYLTESGFSCWLDIGQMGGGDKLYEKIDNGIRAAKVVLSLVTEKYAKSANCNKEVSLSISLGKPMFPLLMEKMPWPPEGAMGPIFSEYLFVRFFQRDNEKKEGIYWAEAKMEELLMQLRHNLQPDKSLVTKKMDDWWQKKTGKRILGPAKPIAQPDEPPQIFISYQWGKQKEVTELYKKLTSLGYSCWQDINQMGAGDSLFDKIDSGVRSCNVVVSCVTQKYSLSLNCRREVSLATSINKPIIPLLLEKMAWPPSGPMSMALTQLQYLDFTNQTKLVTGDSFNVLLVLLAKQSIFKPKTDSKKMAQTGTTMHAATKLKRGKSKPQQPARQSPAKSAQQEESNQGDTKSESRACSIL